jgi:maltose alpha-D-glucosyltransferase/alpha-amylase
VRPYFGDGDECHMAFHFPVMPRIYMALRQEDRMPIIDIMSQTPDIPKTCQWGLFLRNHDELTLEMVTNDERDYMYLAYSADPRTRINLGIRRRLAPLMDNNRRRIELLNSLLFSLPGTPIIYYGDEIGMGDNVYLGDRNGVRTPMQWNSDRNAGFSRANPAMLYNPVIMDPVWGYQALNVEAEESDPSSLINWMRNMIALRKLFHVFGRGALRFLTPANRKILAYLRSFDGEQILCVTNLSRYAQPVDLDLSELAGMTPVEMLGYVEFPPITKDFYRLTLGPYGFLWLELHPAIETKPEDNEKSSAELVLAQQGWGELLPELESSVLPAYLPKQRWFSGKSRQIQDVRVTDWAKLDSAALLLVRVSYKSGEPEEYIVPLAIHDGVVQDGLLDDSLCGALLKLREVPSINGIIKTDFAAEARNSASLQIRRGSAEQSNSSVIYGRNVILKLFRRRHSGPNPEVEVARHLAAIGGFDRVPPFLGAIEYFPAAEPLDESNASAVAMAQRLVPNEGDGWTWTTEELERFYEHGARMPAELTEEAVRDQAGAYVEAARVLAHRTAELHLALSRSEGNPAFQPEEFDEGDIRELDSRIREEATRTFDLLKGNLALLPDDSLEMAGAAIRSRRQIIEKLQLPLNGSYGKRTRVHGDYHLGQVLRSLNDFYIVDFEGEPDRPLVQRRAKHSPFKDVAGMIRSFSYAANATLMNYTTRHPETFASMEPLARLWEKIVRKEFLASYLANQELYSILPSKNIDICRLLDAYILEKAIYELGYELNNRPTWVRIPLAGILSLAGI